MKKLLNQKTIYFLLLFYFVTSLLFLNNYPYMHSDESWLSGLSISIMKSGYSSTEYFFDLYPRYPHAIKILFHTMQIGFINIWGYSLFSVRLVSLLFATASLFVFYKIVTILSDRVDVSLLSTLVLGVDIQFIYASHFARQEIIVLFVTLLCLYHVLRSMKKWCSKTDYLIGITIGLSIGIHPNSFIVALMIGATYLYLIVMKKISLSNLIRLIMTVSGFAILFIGVSFLLDNQFINHYLSYGDTMGVTKRGLEKVFYFNDFYLQLFNQDSVTYYMPPIKLQFILFGVALALGALSILRKRENGILISMIIAYNIGLILIGRYSQPGIVIIFPLFYIIVIHSFDKLKLIIIVAVLVISTGFSFHEVSRVTSNQYDEYLTKINDAIDENSVVLGNLNTEYAMTYKKFYDYRNLAFIEGSFEDYIEENKIEYIIYSEEMDYIYENRPTWNFLYGNVFPYYEEMKLFLEECEVVTSFDSFYSMRIVKLAEEKDWKVTIYRVVRAKYE